MHRSYQPITPTTSKLLKQRWEETYFEEHRRKVASAKSVVDSRPPRTYMHHHLKLKKLQLEEERLATIERDNRILLEKMSQIMRTKGRVDNWNNYEAKSLNRTKRQQELLRVTHENQAVLKRVLAQEPVYNHKKWEDEWLEKELCMESISKYPKEWYKKSVSKKTSPSKSEAKAQNDTQSKKSPKNNGKPTTKKSQEEIDDVNDDDEEERDTLEEIEEIEEQEQGNNSKVDEEEKHEEERKSAKVDEEEKQEEEGKSAKVDEEEKQEEGGKSAKVDEEEKQEEEGKSAKVDEEEKQEEELQK